MGATQATPSVAPYGSWRSPITAESVAKAAVRLGHLATAGDDLYWIELRPHEQGRNVIVRRLPDGSCHDVTPPATNARTRVHEYGGGDFAVTGTEVVFSNFADQRLYRHPVTTPAAGGEAPRPLTAEGPFRYADAVVDHHHGRLICVREDHSLDSRQPQNTIVAVDLAGHQAAPAGAAPTSGQVLVAGNDFYAAPRLSPDGRRLAWLTWNHPDMPWDGTELWVAEIAGDGATARPRRVAGGRSESITCPSWSPDGRLYFVSDRTGWWNLYRWSDAEDVTPLAPRAAEFGQPQWVFGTATYDFLGPETLVCTYAEDGTWLLARLDVAGAAPGQLAPSPLPYTDVRNLRVLSGSGRVALVAGAPATPLSLVLVDPATGSLETVRRTSEVAVDPGYLATPQAIAFPTTGGETAHAFYYPPSNRDFQAPPAERPPLLVKSHGGPTSATSSTLTLGIQYWTSRGIAVLDVNYRGSTGHGRAYRQALDGQWGIVDVDDCVNGALHLAAQGKVDPQRLAISGGSAGGYTTLCALTFRQTFRAGGSYFGVSDLETLATDTHKFESRYLDRLIGPYPERRDLYHQRSPIHHVDRLSCPLIFLQGLEDAIVPPSQAETMVAALRAKGLPVAYLAFPGEQHGFRQAGHIQQALEAELYFYARIFGFELGDPVPAIPIENL